MESSVPVKQEQLQVKEEPSDLNIICVKVEPKEQDFTGTLDLNLDLKQDPASASPQASVRAESLLFCPQCGSWIRTQELQSGPSAPPGAQPRCSFCGQRYSPEALLLEHNYNLDLRRVQGLLGAGGFRCAVCGSEADQVGALLQHMSQHLSSSNAPGLGIDSDDEWSFENEGATFQQLNSGRSA